MSVSKRSKIIWISMLSLALMVISFVCFHHSEESAFAAKKKYRCKTCIFISNCEKENALGCKWITFFEGDEDVKRTCCPGTIEQVD